MTKMIWQKVCSCMKYFQKQTESPVPYFEEALKKSDLYEE